MSWSKVFKGITIQYGVKNGIVQSQDKATRVNRRGISYPRHGITTSTEQRGKKHAESTTRAYEMEGSSTSWRGWLWRGWHPFSSTRVIEELWSRSYAGEAAREALPARTKKKRRRRSNAGEVKRVGAERYTQTHFMADYMYESLYFAILIYVWLQVGFTICFLFVLYTGMSSNIHGYPRLISVLIFE